MAFVRSDITSLIQELISRSGLPAQRIARDAVIAPSYLSRCLSGKQKFSKASLEKLAPVLKVTAEALLYSAGLFTLTDPPDGNGLGTSYSLDQVYCNQTIKAVLAAYYQLMDSPIELAMQKVKYGSKDDTLGLDFIAEGSIAESLSNFDRRAVLITEEAGSILDEQDYLGYGKKYPSTVFFSDPTDRSKQLWKFLDKAEERGDIAVGEFLNKEGAIEAWENAFGSPASITGASSSVTCVRNGLPVCTAIVNLITGDILVAASIGAYTLKLPIYSESVQRSIDLGLIRRLGQKLFFSAINKGMSRMSSMQNFVTFLGDPEKTGYDKNLHDSELMDETSLKKRLIYDLPGGPTRVLYLSTLHSPEDPIGFVLANGEKILEWIHWLPFIRFIEADDAMSDRQPALKLYEFHHARPWTKQGILMSTSPTYSIFAVDEDSPSKTMVLDIENFQRFPNPSLVRCMLIVAPHTNSWISSVARGDRYREIRFAQ